MGKRDKAQDNSSDPVLESSAVPVDKASALLNDRFELIKCVGAGGMSTVYKALDRCRLLFDESDPYVAVKILNQRFQADPKRLAALQQETERCQRMEHPNIVRVYDFHRDGGTVYMSMEYLYGEPLTQRIRTKGFQGLPNQEALRIINAMGEALAYAHSQGLVHCDFKPGNVFLTKDGEVKLIDFGIAQAFGEPEEQAASAKAMSPVYASPDVVKGRKPDPRDDVYALACTGYELLTGVHPFDYRTAIEAQALGLRVKRRRGLTHGQWQAVCRALVFERESRTATVEAFLRGLDGSRLAWRSKAAQIAVGLVIGLLLLVPVALLWWGSEPSLKPRSGVDPVEWLAVGFPVALLVLGGLLLYHRNKPKRPLKQPAANPSANKGHGIQVALSSGTTSHPISRSPFRIGRSKDNDLTPSDYYYSSVSRHHAEIHRNPDGTFAIVDLRSLNGVYLNGIKITTATLNNGDKVEIGDLLLRFVAVGTTQWAWPYVKPLIAWCRSRLVGERPAYRDDHDSTSTMLYRRKRMR